MARERILELKARPAASTEDIPTIFDTALNPDTEKGKARPTIDELSADTLLLLLAGTDTTAHTLTIATYNVLQNPSILTKLQAELWEAMPRKDLMLGSAELEKLPYLRSVIKETLRISAAIPGRLPRVVPSAGAVFCGQRLAPGVSTYLSKSASNLLLADRSRLVKTIVSSSVHVYDHDPNIFSDPEAFRPERWLVGDGESKKMEENMMAFSKGSRMCPGMKYVLLPRLYTDLPQLHCCLPGLHRLPIGHDG